MPLSGTSADSFHYIRIIIDHNSVGMLWFVSYPFTEYEEKFDDQLKEDRRIDIEQWIFDVDSGWLRKLLAIDAGTDYRYFGLSI